VKAGNWPPKIAEFIETMQVGDLGAVRVLPDLKPGKMARSSRWRYTR